MKILYALQGTGNGHICRARAILPILCEHGDVDVLVSGTQAEVDLGYPIKYQLKGMGFIFGKKGGVDFLATYKKNHVKAFWKELQELPVEIYDVVINDFEPVSAWACTLRGKPVVGLSHQAAVLNKKAPQAAHQDPVGKAVLKYYAPTTMSYGFHFKAYDEATNLPVIREDVRALKPTKGKHYTVYLPAYDDEHIVEMLTQFEDTEWQVFSKHNQTPFHAKNISIRPIDGEAFLQSMATAAGILCGAGFETPAEAMYLEKKLLVIPMKGQYEQQCNAAALKKLGVPVIKSLKKKHAEKIKVWLESDDVVAAHYPDRTREIIETVLKNYPHTAPKPINDAAVFTVKKFRNYIRSKILASISR